MTEAEFNQAQLNKEVSVLDAPLPMPPVFDEPFKDDIEAVISLARRFRNALPDAPVAVPKTFLDQFQFVDDGDKKLYAFINEEWVAVNVPSGLRLLASTELSGTNANVDVSFTATDWLKVVFEMTDNLGTSGNALHLQFNGDNASANYITKVEINGGGSAEYAGAADIWINDGAYQRQQVHDISITNRLGFQKRVLWTGTVTNGALTPIITVNGFANWNNTADQITSIRITADGSKLFPIGTKISVYGI